MQSCERRRASIQELRGVCIHKLLLAHWADAIQFHNIQEVNFGALKTSLDTSSSFKRTVYTLQTTVTLRLLGKRTELMPDGDGGVL